MAKTKISEFSATPANNTDIDSINIAEGCAPSGINDAIRELMAQLKDFQTGAVGDSFNGPIGSTSAVTGAFTTLSATGAITSTLATGSAPLVIASTTKVANLNVDLLDGADWASPAALGSTTPAAVSATTLSASSTVSGTGFSTYLASPPAIGGTAAAAGSFTTLSASGNTTLGDASTDTVTVNGYIGVGGAGAASVGVYVTSSALTGVNQAGVLGAITGSSAATTAIRAVQGDPATAAAAFTCSDVSSFYANNGTKGAGSTITNKHGIFIADQNIGANNFGITSGVSSGTNKWNIYASGTAQNYFAGNVGIGSTSPAAKLDVNGSIRVGSLDALYFGGTTNYITGSNGLNYLILTTNGSERLRIDSSGNVGIGTSSPTNALSVTGNANITGNVTLGDATTDSVTVNGYMGVGGAASSAYGVYVRGDTTTGTSQYGVASLSTLSGTTWSSSFLSGTLLKASTAYSSVAGFRAIDAATATGATVTSLYGLRVEDQTLGTNNYGIASAVSSGTNKWNIYASGTANNYFAGNVGLGVTPSAWGSAFKVLQLGGGGALISAAAQTELLSNAYYDTSWKYFGTGLSTRYQGISGQHIWSTAATGTAGNAITFTQALSLTAVGNLLLGGTSDPASAAKCLVIYNGTAPTGNIAGGILYVESGALKYRGSSGTVTTLASA